jgi:hypothetical protein
MLKAMVGVLVAGYFLGAATPAWGGYVGLQQSRKSQVCPREIVPLLDPAQAEGRRVRDPYAGHRHLVVPFLGIEVSPWRTADPASSETVVLPLVAVEQTQGKIANLLPDKSELVLRDTQGKEWKFFIAKDCKVIINNKDAKLADLQAGDVATVGHEMRGLMPMVATEIRATRK